MSTLVFPGAMKNTGTASCQWPFCAIFHVAPGRRGPQPLVLPRRVPPISEDVDVAVRGVPENVAVGLVALILGKFLVSREGIQDAEVIRAEVKVVRVARVRDGTAVRMLEDRLSEGVGSEPCAVHGNGLAQRVKVREVHA